MYLKYLYCYHNIKLSDFSRYSIRFLKFIANVYYKVFKNICTLYHVLEEGMRCNEILRIKIV